MWLRSVLSAFYPWYVLIITGNLCQYNIDECKDDPCQNGGLCFDELGSYYCKCPPGYEGKLCVIIFLSILINLIISYTEYITHIFKFIQFSSLKHGYNTSHRLNFQSQFCRTDIFKKKCK